MEQSKIIDTLETYQASPSLIPARPRVGNDKTEFLMWNATFHNSQCNSLYCGMIVQIQMIQDKSL